MRLTKRQLRKTVLKELYRMMDPDEMGSEEDTFVNPVDVPYEFGEEEFKVGGWHDDEGLLGDPRDDPYYGEEHEEDPKGWGPEWSPGPLERTAIYGRGKWGPPKSPGHKIRVPQGHARKPYMMELTRRQLRELIMEVFIKPDPTRRFGPFKLPPYNPAMPITKAQYDTLVDIFQHDREQGVELAINLGLIPDSWEKEPLLGRPLSDVHGTYDTTSIIDQTILDSDAAADVFRRADLSAHYDPDDYPVLGDNYADQLRNYHKDPRDYLGVRDD